MICSDLRTAVICGVQADPVCKASTLRLVSPGVVTAGTGCGTRAGRGGTRLASMVTWISLHVGIHFRLLITK